MRCGLFFLLLLIAVAAIVGWAWTHHAAQPASASFAARPVPRDGWQTLRAMTANIRLSQLSDGDNQWPNRREFVVKTLLKYEPDILACQEVSPAQGAYLNKELSRWYSYFPRAGVGTSSRPTGRGGGAELLGMLSDSLASLNMIYYRSDRFGILDGEAGPILPEEPQAAATENTFFTLAVLQEKNGNAEASPARRVIVVDTHFRHGQPFAQRCAARLRQRIAGWLVKFPGAGIIVMGDMNHDRTSGSYAILQGGSQATRPQPSTAPADATPRLADAFDYTQKPATTRWGTYHRFTGIATFDTPTDLIFHSPEFSPVKPGAQLIRDQTPDKKWPSDHYFVMTGLEWRRGTVK